MEHFNELVHIELVPVRVREVFSPSPTDQVVEPELHSSLSTLPSSNTNRLSHRWVGFLKLGVALVLPILLETLDQTVIATAQTRIASSFNSLSSQQWIGTSYLLTATVFLPIFGSLADIFGRHNALQLAIAFFAVGSAICTGTTSFPLLISGRAISGIGAGGLTSLSRIILNDSNSLKQNTAQNTLMMFLFAFGYTCGPVIGGALATADWRWCFAVNLPACLVSMVAVYAFLRHHPNPSTPPADASLYSKLRSVDYMGATLFAGGGMLVILGLNWGGQGAWTESKAIAVLVVGSLLLVLLPAWEGYLEYRIAVAEEDGMTSMHMTKPIMPALLFAERDVLAGSVLILCTGMLLFGVFYFLSTYFIIVHSYSQVSAGALLLTFTPGLGIGGLMAHVLVRVFKVAKYSCVLGAVLQPIAAGLFGMAITQDNGIRIIIFIAFVGFSCGLTMPSIAIQLRLTHDQSQVAAVIAFSLFFSTFGGTLGLAQMGTVLNTKAREYILMQGTDPTTIAQAIGALGDADTIAGLSTVALSLVQAALAYGTKWAFLSLVPWVSIGTICTLILSRRLQFAAV